MNNEPYIYYDNRDPDESGWVLRYSDDEGGIGRIHLDEPLDASTREEASSEAARFLSMDPASIGVEDD